MPRFLVDVSEKQPDEKPNSAGLRPSVVRMPARRTHARFIGAARQ
ncbi:hypothetical protein [Streptomyces clavifer]